MIQPQTIIQIADNSGAKIGRVFKIPGSSRKRTASIGELVIFSVQKAEPRKQVKKKDILYGVVVRQKAPLRGSAGRYCGFVENAVVILDNNKKEPIAGRVFGPIPREIGEAGFQKIISLASEVV